MSVHGAPANPISGTRPSSARRADRSASSTYPSSSAGTASCRRSKSRRRPERLVEPGTDAVFDRERHPHGLRDHQDVAEDDRRVHAEDVHRLQGHFDGELRCPHHREEVRALAHGTVLGEIASRLAHHPDGRPLDREASARAEEEIVHRPATIARTAAASASAVGLVATRGRRPARRAGGGGRGRADGNKGRPYARRTGAGQEVRDARARHHQHLGSLRGDARLGLAGEHGPVAHDLVDLDAVLPKPRGKLVAPEVAAGKEDRASNFGGDERRCQRRRRALVADDALVRLPNLAHPAERPRGAFAGSPQLHARVRRNAQRAGCAP